MKRGENDGAVTQLIEPKEGVVDAKEMGKDRYVLICMSFSLVNGKGSQVDDTNVSKEEMDNWVESRLDTEESKGVEIKALRDVVT